MKYILGLLTAALMFFSGNMAAQAQRSCDDPCAPGCSQAGTPACSGGSIRQSSGMSGGGTRPYTAPGEGSGSRTARPTASGDYFSFRVCNKSRKKASVALSYRNENNKWIVQGWWTVNVGDCRRLGNFRKGYFYYYAKNYSGSGEWRGNFKLCVKIPQAFKRVNRAGYKCNSRLLKRFIERKINNSQFTWNLLK